jgi:head-tail adaptor
MLNAGKLDRQVTIESASVSRSSATGAEVKTWAALGAPIWAQVIESATATDEGLTGQMATYAKPTRVRMHYRTGIDSGMRVNLGAGRLLEIIGVAMLGRQAGLELACKEWAHE